MTNKNDENANFTKAEDVVEAEDVAEIEDVVEAEDVTETEDVTEIEDVVEAEDVTETEDVAEIEDVVEAEDVAETKDVAETTDITETEDVVEVEDLTSISGSTILDGAVDSDGIDHSEVLTDTIEPSPEESTIVGSRSDSKSQAKEHVVAILIRGFISFVGAVMLFLLVALIIVKQTVMSPDFMIKVGTESNYFATIAKESSRSIQDLGLGSGVPEGVLTEVVSEDTVKKDFSEYIRYSYEGKTQTLDSTQFVQHVSEVIDKYSQENGLEQTDESKASVAEFAEHAFTERYVPTVQLQYLPPAVSRLSQFNKTLEYMIGILVGVFVLMIVLLFLTTRKVGYRRFSYLSYLFLGSALMTLVGPLFILSQKIISRINIKDESLYKFMTTYFNDIVMYFIYIGVIVLLIGLVCVVTSLLLQRKQRKSIEV